MHASAKRVGSEINVSLFTIFVRVFTCRLYNRFHESMLQLQFKQLAIPCIAELQSSMHLHIPSFPDGYARRTCHFLFALTDPVSSKAIERTVGQRFPFEVTKRIQFTLPIRLSLLAATYSLFRTAPARHWQEPVFTILIASAARNVHTYAYIFKISQSSSNTRRGTSVQEGKSLGPLRRARPRNFCIKVSRVLLYLNSTPSSLTPGPASSVLALKLNPPATSPSMLY